MKLELFLLYVFFFHLKAYPQKKKPHIVFILVDDYGYNDIGYHGSIHGSAIKTPFLDSLAMAGIRLENYYVQPVCSPTRNQLLTGRYQIHTGLQHGIIRACQPSGIPLDNVLLPERLKMCGYSTYMLGKWHVGFFKDSYLPWKRGFDKYLGFLVGAEDYYTKYQCSVGNMCGYSMNSQYGPTNITYCEYSAHLYARKAREFIRDHNTSNPMFMYVALQSVHSPLQVPEEYVTPYLFIKDKKRQTYAGMVAAMEETVKKISQALQAFGMWNDTLLILSTDNGGQTIEGGNNWPLRGRKATLWEGGIRGVGFMHGKILNVPNPNPITYNELFHVSDWYPTLLGLSNCPASSETYHLDGFDQWNSIITQSPGPRTELLHNIDPLRKMKRSNIKMGFDTAVRAAVRVGDWKLLTGVPGDGNWYKPPELVNKYCNGTCNQQNFFEADTSHKSIQLFDIANDPYERIEVSNSYPDVVNTLLQRLTKYNSTSLPVYYPPCDKASNPELHGGYWMPWKI